MTGADDRLQRRPDPDVRHDRRRVRHDRQQHDRSARYGVWRLTRPESVIHFERGMDRKPDFTIIRSLFRFGLPTGVQGIAMNIGGVFTASLHRLARAQRGGAGGVRRRLHRALLADHLDVERADGRVGDDRGPESRRRQALSARPQGVRVASRIGLCGRGDRRRAVPADSRRTCWPCSA